MLRNDRRVLRMLIEHCCGLLFPVDAYVTGTAPLMSHWSQPRDGKENKPPKPETRVSGSKYKGALDTILQQDEELKSLRYILSEVHATARLMARNSKKLKHMVLGAVPAALADADGDAPGAPRKTSRPAMSSTSVKKQQLSNFEFEAEEIFESLVPSCEPKTLHFSIEQLLAALDDEPPRSCSSYGGSSSYGSPPPPPPPPPSPAIC